MHQALVLILEALIVAYQEVHSELS